MLTAGAASSRVAGLLPGRDAIARRIAPTRIGRSAIAAGAAAVAVAAGAAAVAPLAAGAAVPPVAAPTACPQAADSFDLFLSRHCSAGAPPVGTPAQTFG